MGEKECLIAPINSCVALECDLHVLLVILCRVEETLNPILSDFTNAEITVNDKRKSVAKQYYQSSFLQQVSM
jgi:hypothetical protein